MGTIGGSLAHADPAADYPAALLALETKVRLVSKGLNARLLWKTSWSTRFPPRSNPVKFWRK